MIKGRIVSSIDLMCAPDKGDDALVMGVDRELVSIPCTNGEGDEYHPIVDTNIDIHASGSLGMVDITDDIVVTAKGTAMSRVAVNGNAVTITISKTTAIPAGRSEAATIILSYTPEGKETVTRSVKAYVTRDLALQPIINEVARFDGELSGISQRVTESVGDLEEQVEEVGGIMSYASIVEGGEEQQVVSGTIYNEIIEDIDVTHRSNTHVLINNGTVVVARRMEIKHGEAWASTTTGSRKITITPDDVVITDASDNSTISLSDLASRVAVLEKKNIIIK